MDGPMYHLQRDGRHFGPYDLADLQTYIAQGTVLPSDFAWTEGMVEWVTVEQLLAGQSPDTAVTVAGAAQVVGAQKRYYTPSEKIDSKALALVPGFSLLAAVVLGAAYGYISRYNPLIFIQSLITISFGLGMGIAVSFAGKIGGARNVGLLIGTGLAAGFLAEYLGWVFYILANGDGFLLGPNSLITQIKEYASVDYKDGWSIKRWTPKAGTLYTFWAVEAMIITSGSLIIALRAKTVPYCETCKRWVGEPVNVWPFSPIEDPATFTTALERGDYSPVLQMPRAELQAATYTRLALLQCPGCQQEHYLTVESLEIEIDNQNNREENQKTILENLIIDNATYQALEAKQTQHPM